MAEVTEVIYPMHNSKRIGTIEYTRNGASDVELLRDEVRELRREISELKQRKCLRVISEKEAAKEVKSLIESWKKQGKKNFNILDIVAETGIDAEIIEGVLEKFEGKIVRGES